MRFGADQMAMKTDRAALPTAAGFVMTVATTATKTTGKKTTKKTAWG